MNSALDGARTEHREADADAAGAPVIICFAGDVWDGNPHSRHHLMSRLAPKYSVLFIEGVAMRGAVADRHEIQRIVAKLRRPRVLRTVAPGLHVLRPLPIPPAGRLGRVAQLGILRAEIENAIRRLRLRGPRLCWFSQPLMAPLLGRFGERAAVLYCQDRYDAFSHVDAALIQAHMTTLAARCDRAIATSAKLADDLRRLGADPVLLPHGVDVARFATSSAVPEDLGRLERPRIGFVGLIDDHLDFDAIVEVADSLKRGSVVLVGGTNTDVRRLRHRRIAMLGPRPYAEIPAYLQGFDVCILPFRASRLNEAVNPIKLREYLAAGRPTVTAPLPEVLPYRSGVEIANGPLEFAHRVGVALEPMQDSPAARARRRRLVAAESWDTVAARLDTLLTEVLAGA